MKVCEFEARQKGHPIIYSQEYIAGQSIAIETSIRVGDTAALRFQSQSVVVRIDSITGECLGGTVTHGAWHPTLGNALSEGVSVSFNERHIRSISKNS